MCFFSHGGKSLAIGKGLNPRMTSQQPNLSRSCDLRISIVLSVFLSDLANKNHRFFFAAVGSSDAPHHGSLFTFTLLT